MTESTTNLWPQLIKLILVNNGLLIAVPYLIASLLTLINHATKKRLAQWHQSAQLIVGGLGVFIHESSHALACLLFGHRITEMQLINFKLRDNPDRSLGHVTHTYRTGKIWPTIGNLWIGLAPIFGCSISILGLTWLFARPTFTVWMTFAFNPSWHADQIWPLFKTLLTTTAPITFLIWLILCGMIAVGGFDLSRADFKGTIPGTIATVIIVTLITIGLQLIGQPQALTNLLLKGAIPLIVIGMMALILSTITWLLINGLLAFHYKKRH